jgi:hypothetical protein
MIRTSGQFPLFMRVVDEARTPHDPYLVQQGFEQACWVAPPRDFRRSSERTIWRPMSAA